MNIKFRLYGVLLLIIVGSYIPASYSQSPAPHFTLTLANDVQVSGTEYDFDIYLLQTGVDTFQMSGCQLAFKYNTAILNGGTLTCSYVTGSTSQEILDGSMQNRSFNTTSVPGEIQMASRLPPGPGYGAFISNIPPGSRLGRLRIVNSHTFATQPLSADFDLTDLFHIKIGAYVWKVTTYPDTDITVNGTYLNNLGNPTLPIELSTFKSEVNGRQVNLNWTTKTEVNTSKFEIEHALVNAKDASVKWVSVGAVLASGSSNSPKNYSYTEKDLQSGKYQYRLKMIDKNGSYKFSDVIETKVELPKNFEVSQNYPNPFNPSTRINYSLPFDSRVTLEVFNITGEKVGQVVNEEQSAGYYTVNFSSSTLYGNIASGVYIYRINAVDKSSGKSFSSVKKMMLLK